MAKPPVRLSMAGVIDTLAIRRTTVFKTNGKAGAVYAFTDTLKVVPADIAEKLIRRDDLIDVGDSGQTFGLAAKWVLA